MKKLFFIFACLFLSSGLVLADVYVNGYFRKDGTYVKGHYRSDPNYTKRDNWSTYGNVNPYTGKRGTKKYKDYNNYGYGSKKSNPLGSYGSFFDE